MTASRYSNCSAADVMEMPRAFSMSIQSDTVPRRPALPCTAPAWPMTRACRARASVSVDLPASGWLMTANVRRRAACATTSRGDQRLEEQLGLVLLQHPQPPLVGEHGQQLAVGALQHLGAAGGGDRRGRGLVGAQRQAVGQPLQVDRGAELVLHAVGGHLELHRPDGGEHRRLVAAPVRAQHLDHALAVQLLDALAELLVLGGVAAAADGEVLGREGGHRREGHRPLGVEGVADAERGGVDQADDVAGVGDVDALPLAAEHVLGVLGRERPAGAGVGDDHAALEDARADADEGQPVAVRGVHAGLHLEHEGAERVGQRARGRRRRRAAPAGAGARPTRVSSSAPTPKLETAEANSTGVVTPSRNSDCSWSAPLASSSSTSSTACCQASPSRASAASAGSVSSGAMVAPPAVRVNRR